MRATTSVSDQAHLVKKLRFPIECSWRSSVGAALVIEAVGLALLTALPPRLGARRRARPGSSSRAFAFELLLLAGPALVLASLNVFFRDLAQILPPFLMIAFYLTPILYPESKVPGFAARLPRVQPAARSRRALPRRALRRAAPAVRPRRRVVGRPRRGRLFGSAAVPAVPPVVRRPPLKVILPSPEGRRPEGSVRC